MLQNDKRPRNKRRKTGGADTKRAAVVISYNFGFGLLPSNRKMLSNLCVRNSVSSVQVLQLDKLLLSGGLVEECTREAQIQDVTWQKFW
jgi:hypothetical protein